MMRRILKRYITTIYSPLTDSFDTIKVVWCCTITKHAKYTQSEVQKFHVMKMCASNSFSRVRQPLKPNYDKDIFFPTLVFFFPYLSRFENYFPFISKLGTLSSDGGHMSFMQSVMLIHDKLCRTMIHTVSRISTENRTQIAQGLTY